MKIGWIALLIIALLVSAVLLDVNCFGPRTQSSTQNSEVYFGVTFGLNTTSQAKLLIDKVKSYTNLFVIDSWNITTNETVLNEVCDYAVSSGLNIIVYFAFISHVIYPWQINWITNAREKWGNKLLGIYYFDEPGGKQIDMGSWNNDTAVFVGVTNYSDAANAYITSLSSIQSMRDLKALGIPAFTSDYALYWFDYKAGYDTVFAEIGGTGGINSKLQQISECRGAANMQNKQWGAIITWTNTNPPYLGNGTALLEDMFLAYHAGAKYIIVFNYPTYPETNPYGILTQEHFDAMREFWNEIHSGQKNTFGTENAQVAFVLPKEYGSGLRTPTDRIWGLWKADNLSSPIWNNINQLVKTYGSRLDIIYDDPQFSLEGKYTITYYWNTSTT
jgi:hypothetical protein